MPAFLGFLIKNALRKDIHYPFNHAKQKGAPCFRKPAGETPCFQRNVGAMRSKTVEDRYEPQGVTKQSQLALWNQRDADGLPK